jgi:hypothetical protein
LKNRRTSRDRSQKRCFESSSRRKKYYTDQGDHPPAFDYYGHNDRAEGDGNFPQEKNALCVRD